MLKSHIDNTIDSIGTIPSSCLSQLTLARTHYYRMINLMQKYDWTKLLESGVCLANEVEPELFIAQITSPIRFIIFIPDDDTLDLSKMSIKGKTTPSLIELHLYDLGMYMGPFNRKIKYDDESNEISNPINLTYDKQNNMLRIVYV